MLINSYGFSNCALVVTIIKKIIKKKCTPKIVLFSLGNRKCIIFSVSLKKKKKKCTPKIVLFSLGSYSHTSNNSANGFCSEYFRTESQCLFDVSS